MRGIFTMLLHMANQERSVFLFHFFQFLSQFGSGCFYYPNEVIQYKNGAHIQYFQTPNTFPFSFSKLLQSAISFVPKGRKTPFLKLIF